MVKKQLRDWMSSPNDITIGKSYEKKECEDHFAKPYFIDDAGRQRPWEFGCWR